MYVRVRRPDHVLQERHVDTDIKEDRATWRRGQSPAAASPQRHNTVLPCNRASAHTGPPDPKQQQHMVCPSASGSARTAPPAHTARARTQTRCSARPEVQCVAPAQKAYGKKVQFHFDKTKPLAALLACVRHRALRLLVVAAVGVRGTGRAAIGAFEYIVHAKFNLPVA
nr:unnamed protein product [Digitaria exilis]